MESASQKNPSDSQVEVHFVNEEKESSKEESVLPMILVSTELTRRGLSKILNAMLKNSPAVPFDFFIAIQDPSEEKESEKIHLKTSLFEFMHKHRITSETRLTLFYRVSSYLITDRILSQDSRWILGLSSFSEPLRLTTLAAASSDGSCRFLMSNIENPNTTTVESDKNRELKLSSVSLTGLHLFVSLAQDHRQFVTTDSSGCIFFGILEKISDAELYPRILFKDYSLYGALHQCQFNQSGSLVGAGAADSKIYLWDSARIYQGGALSKSDSNGAYDTCRSDNEHHGKKRPREDTNDEEHRLGYLSGHKASVNDICFVNSNYWNAQLVSASSDQTVNSWDVSLLTSISTWPVQSRATSLTRHSGECTILATSHDDGQIRLWDIRSPHSVSSISDNQLMSCQMRKMSTYHLHRRTISQIRWNPMDSNLLASVSHDGFLKVIDLRYSHMARNTTSFPNCKLMCVDWLNQSSLVSGGSDGCIRQHIVS